MNDDEIGGTPSGPPGTTALAPLDPAKVITGARRRRRKRDLTTGSLAAVAVLAVVAGGIIATDGANSRGARPTVVGTPSSTPSARTSTPRATSTPAMSAAQLLAGCKVALAEANPKPGANATQQALLESPQGSVLVIADSKYWAACDSGYISVGEAQVSARRPAGLAAPSPQDKDAFAVAQNSLTQPSGNYDDFEYYWAAGRLPTGVKTVRYTFPDGKTVDAAVQGKYWLMHYWSLQQTPGGSEGGAPGCRGEDPGPAGGRGRHGGERLPIGGARADLRADHPRLLSSPPAQNPPAQNLSARGRVLQPETASKHLRRATMKNDDLTEEIADSEGPADQPVRSRRMLHLAVTGLAVAAVAGIAIAGSAAARTGNADKSTGTAVAGSGPAATPSGATPGQATAGQATPGQSTPGHAIPGQATPGQVTKSEGRVDPKSMPEPKEQPLPGIRWLRARSWSLNGRASRTERKGRCASRRNPGHRADPCR